MAYFAMGMALHSDGSYEDVLALISDGLAWAERAEGPARLANKAAISHARDRLGPEPMAKLFELVARPLATEATPGCWLAGRRLVAIDGTCLDLADTAANDVFFGRPGVMKGERSAFPQARVVALAECGPTPCSTPLSAPTRPRRTRWQSISWTRPPRLYPLRWHHRRQVPDRRAVHLTQGRTATPNHRGLQPEHRRGRRAALSRHRRVTPSNRGDRSTLTATAIESSQGRP